MYLIFDIGNTRVKCGLSDGATSELISSMSHEDVGLVGGRLIDDYTGAIDGVVLVSVVPDVAETLAGIAESAGLSICSVSSDFCGRLNIGYETPHTLGADRIAGALGTWVLHSEKETRPVILVDAGTTINYEVVSADGVHLGGAISPGMELSFQALARGTAQLPEVGVDLPTFAIGSSTIDCLRSGVVHGYVDACLGMVKRLSDEVDGDPVVVGAGGGVAILSEGGVPFDHVEPGIVLIGGALSALTALESE